MTVLRVIFFVILYVAIVYGIQWLFPTISDGLFHVLFALAVVGGIITGLANKTFLL